MPVRKTLALLHARRQPPTTLLNTTFSNELEKLPGKLFLVLDDYHTHPQYGGGAILTWLIWHTTGRNPCTWCLLSRTSPPIPLQKVCVRKGIISELRTRDLRFTPDETASYLLMSNFHPLSRNAITLLEERFEGWPAGLHLAALSLRSAGSQQIPCYRLYPAKTRTSPDTW